MAGQPVRSELRFFALIASIVFGPLFVFGPIAIGVCLFLFASPNIGIPAGLALLACGCFVAYHLLQNFHWVEFANDRIRGRKFITRQGVDEPISELNSIVTLHGFRSPFPSYDVLAEYGGSAPILCKGLEFRFNSGKKITVAVLDMTNVDALLSAVVARHRQLHPQSKS